MLTIPPLRWLTSVIKDDKKSSSAKDATYEMMIWVSQVGDPYPLGFDSKDATCYTNQLGAFDLWVFMSSPARHLLVLSLGALVLVLQTPSTNPCHFLYYIIPVLHSFISSRLADPQLGRGSTASTLVSAYIFGGALCNLSHLTNRYHPQGTDEARTFVPATHHFEIFTNDNKWSVARNTPVEIPEVPVTSHGCHHLAK